MSLREKFRDKMDDRKARKYAERLTRVNQRLEKLADKLPDVIARKEARLFTVRELGRVDEKTLDGYKHLHDICAAANVRIERITQVDGGQYGEYVRHCIAIMPNAPYSTSPDAKLFAPKKPVWVQPSLPGL